MYHLVLKLTHCKFFRTSAGSLGPLPAIMVWFSGFVHDAHRHQSCHSSNGWRSQIRWKHHRAKFLLHTERWWWGTRDPCGLWWDVTVVGWYTKLCFGVVLLGLYYFANCWWFGDTEVGHQEGFWVCTVGYCCLQFVHTMGGWDALWDCYIFEECTRICIGKFIYVVIRTEKKKGYSNKKT